MNRYIILLFCTALAGSCLNKTDKEKTANGIPGSDMRSSSSPIIDSSQFTKMLWIDSSKSLGTITEGDILRIAYRFKNTGSKPLIIERVKPGCGCTIADYPKEPISPGQEGEIKAEFDSHGKEGLQRKNISVYANTSEQTYTLWFDVTINKAK